MGVLRNLVQGLMGAGGEKGGVRLTVFGKHPCWPDYATLRAPAGAAERALQETITAVIGGMLDDAAARNTAAADVLELACGEMIWSGAERSALAVIQPSKDAVGRPYILAAIVSGPAGAVESAVPRLGAAVRDVFAQVAGAPTKQEVDIILAAGEEKLGRELALPSSRADLATQAVALSGGAGGTRQNLLLLMETIQSHMPALRKGASAETMALFVPVAADRASEDVSAWIAFLRELTGPATALTALHARMHADRAGIVVGAADVDALRETLSSLGKAPLLTHSASSAEGAFCERAAAKLQAVKVPAAVAGHLAAAVRAGV